MDPVKPLKIYHYNCDGFPDQGFGCVYRNVQTVLAKLSCPVPTLLDMMRMCSIDSDSPELSSKWIEPIDARRIIKKKCEWVCPQQKFVLGLYVRHSPDDAAKRMYRTKLRDFDWMSEDSTEVDAKIKRSLRETSGTPIIIDNGVSSFAIVGYINNAASTTTTYWVADPHANRPVVRTMSFKDMFQRDPMWMMLFVH